MIASKTIEPKVSATIEPNARDTIEKIMIHQIEQIMSKQKYISRNQTTFNHHFKA